MTLPLANLSITDSLIDFWNQCADFVSTHRVKIFYLAIGVAASILLGFLLTQLILGILRRVFRNRTEEFNRELARSLRRPTILATALSGTAVCFSMLELTVSEEFWLWKAYLFLLAVVAAWAILRAVNLFSKLALTAKPSPNRTFSLLLVNLLRPVACIVVLCVTFFFILQNIFDFNVGALLAGAGIFAMAIAFAAQSTIANLFGTASLILDRPFSIGDRIVVSGKDGTVESIGLRSTKVRSFDGTLWFIPNKEMTESTIENYAARPTIRHIFLLRLAYASPPEKVRRAIAILHEILDRRPLFDMKKDPPRIFFDAIEDSAFRLQAICWFQTQDYYKFVEEKETINFEILSRFYDEGIAFAIPIRKYLPANETEVSNATKPVS